MSRAATSLLAFSVLVAPAAVLADRAGEAGGNPGQHFKQIRDYEEQIMLLDKKLEYLKKQKAVLEEQQAINSLQEAVDAPATAVEPPVGAPVEKTEPDPLRKMFVHAITGHDGNMEAQIRYGQGLMSVRVGDTLPGEWKVTKITPVSVVVTKGRRTRSIGMPEQDKNIVPTGFGAPLLPPPPPVN